MIAFRDDAKADNISHVDDKSDAGEPSECPMDDDTSNSTK